MAEGSLTARWTGNDVVIDPGEAFFASLRGEALIDFDAFRHLTRQGGLLFERKVEQFRRRWMAWTHHPGKFGARPSEARAGQSDVSNIVWVAERRAPGSGAIAFGQPYMRFGVDKWTVTVDGLRQPIYEIDWHDAEGVARIVEMLDNTEYWRSLASLSHPEEWRNAIAQDEKARRQAAEAERQRQAGIAAARAFATSPASTRRVARLLRRFSWRLPERPVPLVRDVAVFHCDISDGATLVRAAECLDVTWSRTASVEDKRQEIARLSQHLETEGYHALLARSGRIYIARDRELLSAHIGAISRSRRGKTNLRVI